MHELAATQAVLSTALDAARSAGAVRISVIDLVIGELSSMVDDSVQFYFDILSRGTAADGAALRIRRLPARAECSSCHAAYHVSPPLDPFCSKCGEPALLVSGGRQFHIDSIEVDE